jgi:hypothetical protein
MHATAVSKKAGREHRVSNCSRRRPCNKNHQPLLHPGTNLIGVLSSVLKTKDALLPFVSGFVVGRNEKREEANILHRSQGFRMRTRGETRKPWSGRSRDYPKNGSI